MYFPISQIEYNSFIHAKKESANDARCCVDAVFPFFLSSFQTCAINSHRTETISRKFIEKIISFSLHMYYG